MINDSRIELHFPVIHQYWMDSGLLGFYLLANSAQKNHPEISIWADDSGIYLNGNDTDLEIFLNEVYNLLLEKYYNTSSPKQIEENTGFYYDTNKDTFVRFPKVKTMGIADVIFSKAPRPTVDSVPYLTKKNGATRKNQLPKEYAHLQDRFDRFLEENNLKADGATFLIDGRNAYQPTVKIAPKPKKVSKICYLCGLPTHTISEVSGTVFPLITSSAGIKSFNSECDKPFSVCWMCDYIGKFVPKTGFYSVNGDDNFIFLIYSHSFKKMKEVIPTFNAAKKDDENRFRNFEDKLGGYFQKPYEQFFSFMYTLFSITCRKSQEYSEDIQTDYEAILNLNISKSPVSYYVLHLQKLGQSYVGKMVWNFTEAVYLFRLFSVFFEKQIDLRSVMQILVDYDQKNESRTLARNRICECVLKKQHIADLAESFVYHINRSEKKFIKPVFNFVEVYEKILYEGDLMKQELIDTAVSLGKTIGLTVGKEGKKGKGDLFRLRKARKPEDFLNEINRIQMRYGVSVTSELYNKGEKFDENFTEFKQFCMIAALNSFNAKTGEKQKGGE